MAEYRARVRARVETQRISRLRVRVRRRSSAMAKVLKIVKRRKDEDAAPVKTAKAGTTRSGAKVEKSEKSGRSRSASSESAGRFIGVTSGLGIAKFQNKTILENAKRRLTDEELAKAWRKEFPNAKADFTAATVRSVRGLVNRGKHGNDAPNRPIPEFDDSGTALPFRGEKKAAKEAAKAEREAEERRAKKIKKAAK